VKVSWSKNKKMVGNLKSSQHRVISFYQDIKQIEKEKKRKVEKENHKNLTTSSTGIHLSTCQAESWIK